MRLYLSLFYFFYFALVGVYVIFMPKVLLDFNYTKVEVGIIYAAAPFMRFLLPFIFKYFINLSQKVYLSSLLLTLLATSLFLGTVENFYFYLLANLLFGAAMGVSLPFVETIALQRISKEEYGKIRLWGSVGFILIALWLGEFLSSEYEALYYLLGTAFFTLIFGFFVLKFDTHSSHEEQANDKSFSISQYWAFWMSVFLMQVAFGGFYNFFTIYETDHGVSLQVVSWMWTFAVVCEIIMLYFQGGLLQRNLLNILKVAIFITAFRWLILYLYPDNTIITFASQSLHAISFALYHSAAISYVFSLYTQKKLAQQFFLGIGFGLGGSIGALLSGQIYGEYIFLIEAVITLVAWGMLLIHDKRKNLI
ncbi:MAG: MFS transporter [Epsilonproteobacteria bacterium]|nr:MFS transporter [Campylobacterota bacterium]